MQNAYIKQLLGCIELGLYPILIDGLIEKARIRSKVFVELGLKRKFYYLYFY